MNIYMKLIFWTVFGSVIYLGQTQDITYEELEYLNATCNSLDNCKYIRRKDDLTDYNCHCGPICRHLDTCCIDSAHPFDPSLLNPSIRCSAIPGFQFQRRHVFMVDDCVPGWRGAVTVSNLCHSDGTESDDPFLSVPVTHPTTGLTYKNYYCSVCNNDSSHKESVFWDVALKSESKEVLSSSLPQLHFDSNLGSWTLKNGTTVYFSVVVPQEVEDRVHFCIPHIISTCDSNWTDPHTENKCQSYMALARFRKWNGLAVYRNPHCALCNFEDTDEMVCFDSTFTVTRTQSVGSGTFFVGLFSLHDKTKRCEEDKVYDSLAKKCRTVYKG